VEGQPTFNLTGHAYAGFWRRVAAYLIDSLLLGVVQALIALTVYAIAPDVDGKFMSAFVRARKPTR